MIVTPYIVTITALFYIIMCACVSRTPFSLSVICLSLSQYHTVRRLVMNTNKALKQINSTWFLFRKVTFYCWLFVTKYTFYVKFHKKPYRDFLFQFLFNWILVQSSIEYMPNYLWFTLKLRCLKQSFIIAHNIVGQGFKQDLLRWFFCSM